MKKSEFLQLTRIIEHLIAREVRKQVPIIITETLRNMKGREVVSEQQIPSTITEEIQEEPSNFKASLRELFEGTKVMQSSVQVNRPQEKKQYTKNPILNEILNQTTGLRQKERMLGQTADVYSPGLDSPITFNPTAGMSMLEHEPEISVMKNVPIMESLPPTLSVLDVVKQTNATPEVKKALTKNYSEMLKLIDKKRGKV